ncbi:MAG: phenylalanine--tRNA ligase subunit beta [Fretibacterium sp.]|nr:phenylalanine--tRNA ligase subunit beta [Fretibacterium sp.]
MFVSWELLKDFIELDISPEEAAERLTLSGTEVESMTRPEGKLKGVVVARIETLEKHPSDGHLLVAHLDSGGSHPHICVTSAQNVKEGDLVFYAGPGSILPDGTELGTRNFSGVTSAGMMLSAAELGLPDVDSPDGLLVLPSDAPVGAEASALYHIGDTILDVSITPNRGDLLSVLGIARELKGLFPNSTLTMPYWLRPLEQERDWAEKFGTISLPDKGCLCYRLGLATGAKMGPSPLTARIDLCHLGMRPIVNAVDVTNYVMLTLGQPLHAFDLGTLPAREITVRAAHEGEVMTTLDGKERALTPQDMLITSGGEAIALAGVMGGQQTGINDDTHTVVVESACFSPVRVGHTSRRLGIGSEAAFRFARTVDPNLSRTALSASLTLMRDWCGAEVDYRPMATENEYPVPKDVTLTKKKLSTYLSWGNMDEATRIIEGFGIKHTFGGGDERTFLPPTWRPDIAIEEDLIEEVGRFRGYNDAPSRLPGEPAHRADIGGPTRLAAFVRQALIARGYVEVMTYSFLPEDFPSRIRLPRDDLRAHPLMLANPISRDQTAMRTTLVPGLLMSLKATLASGWRGPVRVFEQGRAFLRETMDSSAHVEIDRLAGLAFNGSDPRTPWKGQEEDFYSVKADVTALIEERGFRPVFVPGYEPFAHAGQTAEVRIAADSGESRKIGWLARLKPALEQELDVSSPVCLFELDLAPLEEAKRPNLHPVSSFPASLRDISLLVSNAQGQDTVAADIAAVVHEAAQAVGIGRDGGILESLRLFDVYEGKGIPEGFRSMAYSLSYRLPDRTLKDEEVEAIHSRVRESLSQKGYNIR